MREALGDQRRGGCGRCSQGRGPRQPTLEAPDPPAAPEAMAAKGTTKTSLPAKDLEALGAPPPCPRGADGAVDRRHLRDYLKRLPDFEDVAAEERALDLVAKRHDREEALWFLLHWPEPHRAARLVLEAARPLDGDL